MNGINYSVIQLLLIIITLPIITVAYGSYGRSKGIACDPADPLPLRRIDLRMIKGNWRLFRFLPPKRFPFKDLFPHFNLIVKKSYSKGSAPGEIRGRNFFNCTCTNIPTSLVSAGGKNRFRGVSDFEGFFGVQEWRFLDKIGDFMIAQLCIEFDKNGRCTDSLVDVLSRKKIDDIPLDMLKRLNQSTRKTLCVDIFEDMLEWPGGNDCPPVEDKKIVKHTKTRRLIVPIFNQKRPCIPPCVPNGSTLQKLG